MWLAKAKIKEGYVVIDHKERKNNIREKKLYLERNRTMWLAKAKIKEG